MSLQLEQDRQKTEILVYPTTHYLTPELINEIGPNDALLYEAHLRGVCDKLTVDQPNERPNLPDLAKGYRGINELIDPDIQKRSRVLLGDVITNSGNPIRLIIIDGDLPDEEAKELVGDSPPFNIDPALGALGIYLSPVIGLSGYEIIKLARDYNHCIKGNKPNASMTKRDFLRFTGSFLASLVVSIPLLTMPVVRNTVHNGATASVDSVQAALSSEYPYFLRVSEMRINLRNIVMAMNINAYASHSPNSVNRVIALVGEAHKDVNDDVNDIERTEDKLKDHCDLIFKLAEKIANDERLDSAQRNFVMWNYIRGLTNYYVFNEKPEDTLSNQSKEGSLSAQAYSHKYLLENMNHRQISIQARELLINAMITQMLMDDLYLSRINEYTRTNSRQVDSNQTRHPTSYNTFEPNENTEIIYFPKTGLIPRKFSDGNEIVGIAIYKGNSYPLTKGKNGMVQIVIINGSTKI